jgi:hypothetical protein
VTLLPPALMVLGLLQVATRHDAAHRELLLGGLVIAVTQVLPGLLLWRALRPRAGSWIEDVAMGAALGAVLAVPSQVVAAATGLPLLAGLVPVALGAVLLVVPAWRRRVASARCTSMPWWWSLLVAGGCALTVRMALEMFAQPVRWTGWATPYVDLVYHEALAGDVAHRFPPHYPQLAEYVVHYHWFGHAWMAQVSGLSGTPVDVVLVYLMSAWMVVLAPFLTACVAVRLVGTPWAGPLAVGLAFLVSDFDVWGASRDSLNPIALLSPTQTFGVVALLPVLMVVVLRWRGELSRWTLLLLVPLLVVAGGGKGSILPVLAVGYVAATAAMVVARDPRRWKVLADAGCAVVVLWLVQHFVFGGGTGGAELSSPLPFVKERTESLVGISPGLQGPVVIGLLLGLSQLVPAFLAAAAPLVLPRTRTDPVAWFLAASGASGIAAVVLLYHRGSSQYYFLKVATVPLALAAAWGLVLLVRRTRRPAPACLAAAVVGLVTVTALREWQRPALGEVSFAHAAWVLAGFVVLVASAAVLVALRVSRGSRGLVAATVAGVLTSCAVAGLVPSWTLLTAPLPSESSSLRHRPGAIHGTEVAAGRWIERHSEPDDLVMTNRHCRTGRLGRDLRCDAGQFTVAAYSQRDVLVEGWAYTKPATVRAAEAGTTVRGLPFWDPALIRLNDKFISSPTAAAARQLYALGVRWVYVDDRLPHASSLEPYARERLALVDVSVSELRRPRG